MSKEVTRVNSEYRDSPLTNNAKTYDCRNGKGVFEEAVLEGIVFSRRDDAQEHSALIPLSS
jgi:hypothetical protein